MDFVDVLLSLPGENGKEHMEDVEIKALMQDMIAAATDTSSVTNEWVMAEVIKNPRVLRKIQEELDAVVDLSPMVVESDLPHLTYLCCVVRESFWMHPAGPFLISHEYLKPTTIMGYDIPAQTRIFINTHVLGRNPRILDDIDKFRPERHLPADGGRLEISHLLDFKGARHQRSRLSGRTRGACKLAGGGGSSAPAEQAGRPDARSRWPRGWGLGSCRSGRALRGCAEQGDSRGRAVRAID